MKSPRPKVLHRLAGRSMIEHVLSLAAGLQTRDTVVVLAPDMADVAAEVERGPQPATIAFQEPQLGTGHALMVARDHLPPSGEVLVLYGDTPLLLPASLTRLLEARRAAGAAVAVLGMRPPDPAGYGRLAFEGRDSRRSWRSAMPMTRSGRTVCATPASWRSTPPGSEPPRRPGAQDAQERVLPDRRGRARARAAGRALPSRYRGSRRSASTRRRSSPKPRRSCRSGCGGRPWPPA